MKDQCKLEDPDAHMYRKKKVKSLLLQMSCNQNSKSFPNAMSMELFLEKVSVILK
jgi:hypothetical protein